MNLSKDGTYKRACKILMKNKILCIELLELILRIKIKDIVFMAEQKPIEITADARGIRLDVYVEDENERISRLFARQGGSK